jgi:hypothetical protein
MLPKWTCIAQIYKKTIMTHKGIRIALVIIEVFIDLGAIDGSIAILTGAFEQWLPLAWLVGTPFRNYTIPGLILLFVIGGGMLVAEPPSSFSANGRCSSQLPWASS